MLAVKMNDEMIVNSPDEMFELGEQLATMLSGGEAVLLFGGLGAGKTLLTKGILGGLGYDIDEVTSPSFTLVNLYPTDELNVYHIDLWRIESGLNAGEAVGLDEIFEDHRAVVIIEWADRLGGARFPNAVIEIRIEGDGAEPRKVSIFRNAAHTGRGLAP
jgi:tRNA threonylcarbamoyladenosine biosynthesis protein TsaE